MRNTINNLPVVAYKPYSGHPDDSHLSVVICHNEDNTLHPYVAWIVNTDSSGTDSAFSGTYCNTLHDALVAFNRKGGGRE